MTTNPINPNATTMTEEEARRLYEAFGPCSVVYECLSPAEVREDFERDNSATPTTIAQWAELRLTVESITLDRMQVSEAEYDRALAGIRARLAALGVLS